MTAYPLTMKRTHAPARGRLRSRFAAWIGCGLLAALMAFGAVAFAHAAERVKGEVKVSNDAGYTRLAFRFEETVDSQVRVSGAILVIAFKSPVRISVDRLNSGAPDYISAARIDPDGMAIRIALARKVKINSIPAAERLYVDFLPPSWTGTLPGLPQEVVDELATRARAAERELNKYRKAEKEKIVPTVRVKVVKLPTFMRYVFELPGTVSAVPERAEGKFSLRFDQQVEWDLADAKASLPSTLESIKAEGELGTAAVDFQLNGEPEVRSFNEERSIIVDVATDAAAPPQATAPNVEGQMKPPVSVPAIAAPETVPAKEASADEAPAAKETTAVKEPGAPKSASSEMSKPATAQQSSVRMADEAPVAPKPEAMAAAKDETTPLLKSASAAKPTMEKSVVAIDSGAAPAPNLGGTVVAVANESGDNLRVAFPFAVPTPAAVFRRADTLWLVFDSAADVDVAALNRDASQPVKSATFTRGADGEGVVRLKLTRPAVTSLGADGPGWILSIGDAAANSAQALSIVRSVVGSNLASLGIRFEDSRKVHRLADPEIGDRLLVVTALPPVRGFLKPQDFVELRALPSAHGVVVQPLADDLVIKLESDNIAISRPAGLALSPPANGSVQSAASFQALVFDTQVWGFDRQAPFLERRSELIELAAGAPAAKRRQARFDLARFYLAREMGAEAKGVLDVAMADRGMEDVTGSVLKAVADLMLNRPEQALKELSKPQIGSQHDAPLWRAISLARQGKWADARAAFKAAAGTPRSLPIELQRVALREEMRTSIEVRDFAGASRVANEFEIMGIPVEHGPAIMVLTGRLYQGLGRTADALTSYRAAAASSDRRAAAQGRLREIVLLQQSGDMPRREVTHELETLTTVWRGDETEAEGLQILANLYTLDSRYRDAFHVMRTALYAQPNSDLTRKIQDEAAATFESLFLADKGDALPPVEALGLFYDFRELTPIGRRGDEMIRKLADRLVSVDLLDQAAELLQHQVDNRLQGAARARVAIKLATIYLMARKPDRALSTLQKTRLSELSNELRDHRLLLEARAMSDTGRHQLALEVIANIKGREATHLRAGIYWAAKEWRNAAEEIELMYGGRWREFTPLTERERADILRAAIGYALADEQISLNRLRDKYAAKLADGPDRRAFDVVTMPAGIGGPEFHAVASKVAKMNTLSAFLDDLQARYPERTPPPAAAPIEPAKPPAKDDNKVSRKDDAVIKAPPAEKSLGVTGKTDVPEKVTQGVSPPPSKLPSGVPLKPDKAPTGSIGPRFGVR